MGIYRVEEFLARAKAFIAVGDENSLRHACLELRFCLESIVYRKLADVGDQLPLAVYKTWQPPKALKLLLSFEPRADQDVSISVCLNTADGKPIGEWLDLGDYRMFSVSWLNKNYSKLGRFLHMTTLPEYEAPPELTASMIEEIVNEIERVASADLVMSMNSVTAVPCTVCQSDMYASHAQIEAEAAIECYQEKCKARHHIRKDGDGFTVDRTGLFSVPCRKCEQRLPLESIKHDEVKECVACGHKHMFRWSYASLPDAPVKAE
ncbi:hypothetical protein [Pseudomonas violetae]|uniref:Uncharacterized protein n=1 Tax=Pseudomonas violetae TaxID=2915813 RepID=A0ABT0F7Y7_9PSED|nr:hypothetical protein [Pseudomonas violetae]MCK1794095.1 hypothetical protein [Pseudomonas violetae]